MKLTRITKIRRHRVFRDFAWPTDLHTFAQFNVVYGWNGCGKTTLSALLALVEKRAALSEGEVEFEFDSTTKVAGTEFASNPVPQVRVFNRDFINSTLQSAGAGIAPIYFLGEDSIEKQAQVEKLRKDLAWANTELATATSDRNATERKLDEFRRDKAKFIKELLTTGNSTTYNNYDKRRFSLTAQGMTAQDASLALLSENEKTRLRSKKDAQPKNVIEDVAAPSVDFALLRKEVNSLVGRYVVAETLEELTRDTSLASWVQRGLQLHSGAQTSETCRFCNQSLGSERRAALEAHFNDAFATLQRELGALLFRLRSAKQSLRSVRPPESSLFYDHLGAEATTAIDSICIASSSAEGALDALIACVEVKCANPFADVPACEESAAGPVSLTEAVAMLNVAVSKHNKTTEGFQRSVTDACEKLERCYVAEAHAEYVQLAESLKRAVAQLDMGKAKPAAIEGEIEALERQILEHRRPADELTDELRTYLGRDELRFEVKGSGYSLTRGGQAVSHLSEGERTAIVFLYFLKSLQDKTFDMANGIVVIDDPVSSLDANALFSAFGHMKECTKQCGQLFVFTHSFAFFRLVKNWFNHLPNQRKADVDRRPARFFLLRHRRHTDGSRTSQLGPIDRLLAEHESEYQYLFKRVYDEAHRTDVDSLEHHYGLPNVARRLIESFLAFRFPEMSGDLGPRLERVTFDNAKKTRILRLLNTYSHASAISDPEHDLSLLAETQPVLLDVLDMMKAVDKEHYDGLAKLIVVGDNT